MTTRAKVLWAIGILTGIGAIAYFTRKRWMPAAKKLVSGPLATCNSSILFIGDSLTAYAQSYADQLRQICPNLTYKKIAKVGEKTDWMHQQMINELKSNKWDVVVIWGGVNDIYARNSVTEAKGHLSSMYSLAQENKVKLVALTVIPTRTYKNATNKTVALTNELNEWIRGNPMVNAVVDANKVLSNSNNGTKAEYLQADTLHLTTSGQKAVMQEFEKVVL